MQPEYTACSHKIDYVKGTYRLHEALQAMESEGGPNHQ